MLPDTVPRHGRTHRPAGHAGSSRAARRQRPWRIAEGRARRGEARRAALAELVGSDIEEQLHTHYRGEEIYVARCHKALVRWRDLEIVERFEQGLRDGQTARSLLSDLARQYNLSDRWIWEIVNRPERAGTRSNPPCSTKAGAQRPGRRLRADPVSAVEPLPLIPRRTRRQDGGMSTSSPQRLYAAPATTPPPSWPSPAASVVTLCWQPAPVQLAAACSGHARRGTPSRRSRRIAR
ncbi:Mor transcription activator family protein [Pseudomonas aeruginosa]|uniref:Mor transcription activator family protein n=1 Tax=Pseudomonas aeruginosa TaxID=287 RepID=UPI001FD7F15E|nr:Mor transcription activator family protein [Pseudomonas aeruginosa]